MGRKSKLSASVLPRIFDLWSYYLLRTGNGDRPILQLLDACKLLNFFPKNVRGILCFIPSFLVLSFCCGMLTGCTSLVTTFNRIHAAMTNQEPNEQHNYGAFFSWSLASNSERARNDPSPVSVKIRK
jgi:hypothetical protein